MFSQSRNCGSDSLKEHALPCGPSTQLTIWSAKFIASMIKSMGKRDEAFGPHQRYYSLAGPSFVLRPVFHGRNSTVTSLNIARVQAQPNVVIYAILFVAAFFSTLALTPLSIRLAHKVGAIDHPSVRKIHDFPIPRLGGLAVAAEIGRAHV